MEQHTFTAEKIESIIGKAFHEYWTMHHRCSDFWIKNVGFPTMTGMFRLSGVDANGMYQEVELEAERLSRLINETKFTMEFNFHSGEKQYVFYAITDRL